MLAIIFALTAVFVSSAVAAKRYTVWSSVIFSRTGDRTPEVLGTTPETLTSLGARQQQKSGEFFRERYVAGFGNLTYTNGIGPAPLIGLSEYIPDVDELYVQALDEQITVASAQAFLQGFYPPVSFNSNTTSVQTSVDSTSVLANGSYAIPPLDGYRYAQIHVSGAYDPEFVYLGGSLECPAFDSAVIDYLQTSQFAVMEKATSDFYHKIGSAFLDGVLAADKWGFVNAYAIYDYLSYQNEHNATANELFSQPQFTDSKTGVSDLDLLKWYADEQTYAWYGNMYDDNAYTDANFSGNVKGSISTIAGNTFAAKMLAQLQTAVQYKGSYYKLNLLFGDFEPLMSFFALASLPSLNSDFYGMPNYGSVGVFELFSWANPSVVDFPSEDELWVRFYFRNGTDGAYTAYSLFNNGPDMMDMKWTDFQAAMMKIMIGDVGEWCTQCGGSYLGSDRIFCAYWNASISKTAGPLEGTGHHSQISPAVGGVIGAVVTLVLAGLIFALVMLFAGVRLHRVQTRKSELGGFKGSQKLASDKDLTLPKGGAMVGASVETGPGSPVEGAHERVGSWELKQNDMPNIAAPTDEARRPSFEEDDVGDLGAAPFRKPTEPDERV